MLWNIISWCVVGGLAGWIANLIMHGKGKGLVRNIIIGIVGSLVGGFVAGLIGISAEAFSIGGILIAIAGACLLIFLGRLIFK